MRGLALEAIVVPFDVDRVDKPTALGPQELLARGLLNRLEAQGWTTHVTRIGAGSDGSHDGDGGVTGGAGGDGGDGGDGGTGQEAATQATVARVGRGVAQAVALARARGRFPLVLSGGCLAALGVVAGLQRQRWAPEVVWIDAHGDFNTPASSLSGYLDGMALAALCGICLLDLCAAIEVHPLSPADVVHWAGRCFDPPETQAFQRWGVRLRPAAAFGPFDSPALTPAGPGNRSGSGTYLHVDLDGLDPLDAPAVGQPCAGGPPLAAVLAALAEVPRPLAMTLATASFSAAGAEAEEGAARTIEACQRLLDVVAGRVADGPEGEV